MTENSKVIYQSFLRPTIDDLNFILQHNEKLKNLPDLVECNVVYRLSLTTQTKDIWKIDGYRWKYDKSIAYPQSNPIFTERYYYAINSDREKDSRCVKHVYISSKNELDVIVCYNGMSDSTSNFDPVLSLLFLESGSLDVPVRLAQGNSKSSTAHLFQCTLSSTIKEIDTLLMEMSGSKAYKHLIATNDAPRNVAQCQYRRQKCLQEQRISNNELKNLFLLSFDLKSYFKLLQIQPELLAILIHDDMKEYFFKLLLMTKETITLYYDTTFSLGEIYVSARAGNH